MKKFLVGLLALGVTTLLYAGVSKIRSNGNISGVPSYQVACTSGSTHIIYKKNGTWYKSGSHMGDRYNSWSSSQVADFLCN